MSWVQFSDYRPLTFLYAFLPYNIKNSYFQLKHTQRGLSTSGYILTVLWCCEGPQYSNSDISNDCRHSIVVCHGGVQSLPQYHPPGIPCCTNLSGFSSVWQVYVGWVTSILDLTGSRAIELTQKSADKCCING